MRPEEHKDQTYTILRIKRRAHRQLKLAATAHGLTLVDFFDELANQYEKTAQIKLKLISEQLGNSLGE